MRAVDSGIRFVVDPGYVKLKMYDSSAKMESLRVCPISRTAAKQRAGRAGEIISLMVTMLLLDQQLHFEP